MSQIQPIRATEVAEPLHPQPPTPVAARPKSSGGELRKRIFTATLLVPSLLYVISLGGLLYLAAVVGIILLGLREFYRLIENKGADPLVGAGYAAGAALPVVAYVGNEYHATILMTAVLLGVMVAQLQKAQIAEALASISGTFFGVFYVGWLFSHAVVLRGFHEVVEGKYGWAAAGATHPDVGVFLMVFTASTVVLTDAGAYFAGRTWGKRKLAASISPGKTVEGALGGIVVGTAGGLVTKALFDLLWPELSAFFGWWITALFATVAAVMGTVGDLVESLLKRDAARKDAGDLLPGMGGVLDRIDSSLLAIPVIYYVVLAYVYLRVG